MISQCIEMSQSIELAELQKLVNEQSEMYPLGPSIALTYLSVLKDCETHSYNEGLEVKRLGGLHVIGTSLHESRRIDNQGLKLDRVISKLSNLRRLVLILEDHHKLDLLELTTFLDERVAALAEGRSPPALNGSSDIRPLNMEDFKFA